MKILAVIPARGGSKSIPNKNIYPLHGKPLLSYAIEALVSTGLNIVITVSTDSEQIKEVALKYQQVIVIDRPHDISGDEASTESALIHAVNYMRDNYGMEFEYVLTVQPTSPLRTKENICNFVNCFEKISDKYDSQVSLTKNTSDFWIETDSGQFERLFKDAPRRRQSRKPLYTENSSLYITSVDALFDTGSILGNNCTGFILPENEAIDINEPLDIIVANAILDIKER